jgi:hypothetical protein
MLSDPGEVQAGNRRSDVERREIERNGPIALRHDPLSRDVDRHGRRDDDLGACPTGQGSDVDLEVLAAILPGHEPGHHSGVDGNRCIHDDRETGLWWRLFCKSLQDLNV